MEKEEPASRKGRNISEEATLTKSVARGRRGREGEVAEETWVARGSSMHTHLSSSLLSLQGGGGEGREEGVWMPKLLSPLLTEEEEEFFLAPIPSLTGGGPE